MLRFLNIYKDMLFSLLNGLFFGSGQVIFKVGFPLYFQG